jgi:TIR domain
MNTPRAFISYSWDDVRHRHWVQDLAERLRRDGIAVTLDVWEVVPGDQLPHFMERAVRENDYVLIICTPKYKSKSDDRAGGVGYEGDVMTAEVFATRINRKFIPILRRGKWHEAAPSWLLGVAYIDMSRKTSASAYSKLLQTLYQQQPPAPPIGQQPDSVKRVHLKDLLIGIWNGYSGPYAIVEEWFFPEGERMIEALRKGGLGSAVDSSEYPRELGDTPHLNMPGMSFTCRLTFILNASINSDSTSVVVEELWVGYVRPYLDRLQRLYKKWERHGFEWQRHGFKIGMEIDIYYKLDQLSVITEIAMSSTVEARAAQELVSEAQWKALKWVEERGVTSSQLVFSIQSGALAKFPRWR